MTEALGDIFATVCVWMIGATCWSAVVYGVFCVGARARRYEAWTGYWIIVLAIACTPPLLAPLFLLAPSPLPTLELDGAIVAANATQAMAGAPSLAHGVDWLRLASFIAVCVYCVAVVRLTLEFFAGRARLNALVAEAVPLAGFALRTSARVLVTAEQTSPFCLNRPRPTIVLSRASLDTMSETEVAWVVTHETSHLRRRDPALFEALAALGILLCFNPFVRAIAARLRLAAELTCDADVLVEFPNARHAYAQTLVRSLSVGERLAPAFGSAGRACRIRIAHILDGNTKRTPRKTLIAFACAGLIIIACGAAAAASASRAVGLMSTHFEHAIAGRVTLAFGAMNNGRPHAGVDVAAPPGAAVRTPAPARVLFAGSNYQGQAALGTVVVLGHANGWTTVFAHLQSAEVRTGAHVRTGQPIGLVGSTGVSSGPHVHMEMLRGGKHADPTLLRATS